MVAEISPTGLGATPPGEGSAKLDSKTDGLDSSFLEALDSAKPGNLASPSAPTKPKVSSKDEESKTDSAKDPKDSLPLPKGAPVAAKNASAPSNGDLLKKILKDGADGVDLDDEDGDLGVGLVAAPKDASSTKVSLPPKVPLPLSSPQANGLEALDSQGEKSLEDIKKDALSKNLNLKELELSKGGKGIKLGAKDLIDKDLLDKNMRTLNGSLQARGDSAARSISQSSQAAAALLGDSMSEFSQKELLLADLLNRYDAADNAKRRMLNEGEKLQYKVGDGDKALVIDRRSKPPKNIVDSKLRNEEREQAFLEKMHEILGDEELGDLIDSKARRAALAGASKTLEMPKIPTLPTATTSLAQGMLGGQGGVDSQNLPFDFDTNKAFDEAFTQNLKHDKAKVTETEIKDSKKVEEGSKERIEAKSETSGVQTKQELTARVAMAKETLRYFASQLKDEILNYKPPVTKINLELNPASLGQVSLSISKKGKDLQVSITSNASVMSLFVQNAQDLRQNLMQIGFNNLDLSFGSHGNGAGGGASDGQENEKESPMISIEEAQEAELRGEVPQSLEIRLSQYA